MSQIKVVNEQDQNLGLIHLRYTYLSGKDPVVYDSFTDQAGNAQWPIPFWPKGHYTIEANLNSDNPRYNVVTVPKDDTEDLKITLESVVPPFPPAPTREQVCGVTLTFQGLIGTTKQYGAQPWFEPVIQTLTDPVDRQAIYQQKKDSPQHDTHQIIEFNTDDWGPNPSPQRGWAWGPSPSMEHDPQRFLALTEEVILAGLIPIVAFDGDDGSAGHVNAMRQLPILVSLMQSSQYGDLTPYILFARLWDSVFYGSTPDEIRAFGVAFRALLPQGHLAIEHNPGHIPTGEGDADYLPGGAMTTYDVLLSEFNMPPPDDTVWQIAGRTIRPYHRPPDQPAGDDPSPPFYLGVDNPRGPFFACAFETWGEYNWVRVGDPHAPAGQALQRQIEQDRAYLKALGYRWTG